MRRDTYRLNAAGFVSTGSECTACPEQDPAWNARISTNLYLYNPKIRNLYFTGSRSPQTTLWATAPARMLCENNDMEDIL